MNTSPNIIVFHVDSWDGRKRSFLGQDPAVRTPNADRLAAWSMDVPRAYCNTPLCCPSRAILWSGQYAHRTGAWNNHRGLPVEDERFLGARNELVNAVPEYPTLMSRLREAGYRTNLAGVMDFTSGGHSLKARLGAWLRASGLETPMLHGPGTDVAGVGPRANEADWVVVDAATDWLRRQEGPFFLSLGVRAPHPFRTTSSYWLEQIDPEAITLPEVEAEPHPIVASAQRARGCDQLFADDQRRFLRQRYAAMIAEADAMLGAVMEAVAAAGLWPNTYFVFLSDHGEMNLEHNLVYKSMFHEPSSRVLLSFAGPGIEAGRSLSRCASLADVCPTLLELAGLTPGPGTDGRSLAPVLHGATDERPDEAFAEYHANDIPTGGFMLRQGDWKYHVYVGYPSELFHLPSDPGELDNRAAAEPQHAGAMDRRLREIVNPETVDAEAKEADRAAFAAWRAQQDRERYHNAMADLYGAWDDDREAGVEAWLRGKGGALP